MRHSPFVTLLTHRNPHKVPRRLGRCARAWRFVRRRGPQIGGAFVSITFFTLAYVYFGMYQPPAMFPSQHIVTIPEGTSMREVAHLLQGERVVRSAFAVRALFSLQGERANVRAGDYLFENPIPVTEVVQRVQHGEYGLIPKRVVIPEGATTYAMAEIFANRFERITVTDFLLLAEGKEGYLFPDTYFFMPNVTTTEVVDTLERTFYERLSSIDDTLASFGRPVHEVVTMASLLEKEARNHDERREIAGILWGRLSIDMPLQVDAVFGYIKRTETFSPLFSDLEVDSPYNTYKYQGLPPGPIGSPSLSSLEAAVTPLATDAVFYLHGRDGVMRVARTYAEHLVNRRRYLD